MFKIKSTLNYQSLITDIFLFAPLALFIIYNSILNLLHHTAILASLLLLLLVFIFIFARLKGYLGSYNIEIDDRRLKYFSNGQLNTSINLSEIKKISCFNPLSEEGLFDDNRKICIEYGTDKKFYLSNEYLLDKPKLINIFLELDKYSQKYNYQVDDQLSWRKPTDWLDLFQEYSLKIILIIILVFIYFELYHAVTYHQLIGINNIWLILFIFIGTVVTLFYAITLIFRKKR